MFSSLHEFIAEPGQFRRRCGFAPFCRQLPGLNSLSGQIVGNFRNRYNKISRGIVLVEMDEILQQGEGLMLRSGLRRTRG
jgi:hypothetical protein